MPKMALAPENRTKNSFEFPKLFLEKGERARIVLLDPEPLTEYVHTLRAPQIVNGTPVYEKDMKGNDVMKMDFVGRPLCLGSFDVIADKGLDVNCPICAESKNSDAVNPPERRHALNVIRYQTKPGGFQVQEPYQVELLVWAFADKIHSWLIDQADEWGDLRAHDLLLGPCEVKQFQKMDLAVASKAEWLTDDARKSLTMEVFKANALEDLTPAVGRKNKLEFILEDLGKVMDRHAIAHGKKQDAPVGADEVDVDGILDPPHIDALNFQAPDEAKAPEVPKPKDDVSLPDLDAILNL